MQIFVINLDRDSRRLDWMDGQLKARGLAFQRFPAFTPDTVPSSIAARFHERALDVLLPSNIACFSSHLGVAERLLAGDEPFCLVLEDDVELLCSGEELREIALKCAGFDMLKLNDWPKSATLEVGRAGRFSIVRYLHVPRGTGSYVLSRRGAGRLLERAVRLAISTDNFIRAEAYLHLDIAGVLPPPIPQDRFGVSSIDPAKVRSKARNRRYFYEAQAAAGPFTRTIRMARQLGAANLVRLALAQIMMRARRVKRDREERYVLKARRTPASP